MLAQAVYIRRVSGSDIFLATRCTYTREPMGTRKQIFFYIQTGGLFSKISPADLYAVHGHFYSRRSTTGWSVVGRSRRRRRHTTHDGHITDFDSLASADHAYWWVAYSHNFCERSCSHTLFERSSLAYHAALLFHSRVKIYFYSEGSPTSHIDSTHISCWFFTLRPFMVRRVLSTFT